MDVAAERWHDDADRVVRTAWFTAVLSRTEKIPALNTLLTRTAGPERLTVHQRKVQVEMLSEWIGARMQPISDAAKHALERLRARG